MDPVGEDTARGRAADRGIPGRRGGATGTVDAVLGHTAAHVRMSVPRLCPEYGDVIVWGQASAIGFGTVDYPGQVLDVWVVDVDGLLVLVHTEVSPGLPEPVVEETLALFESMTLDRVRR